MSHRDYLFSLEQLGIKLGLDQIRALVDALGRPDAAYPSIVVAGTNGKGSVAAMVERGLRAAGYRTGRFTSPHLVRLEERFAIGGQPIDRDHLERVAGRVRAAADRLPAPPTFFEATTALALEAFREAEVNVAVLEVGLGGRLDATNVVSPRAVAITAIAFDHEDMLGHTIDAIAREKAGVIKPGAVVVLAANPAAVQDVVRTACVQAGAAFVFAPDHVTVETEMVLGRARLSVRTPRGQYETLTLALAGRHQVDNAVAAIRLLEELSGMFVVPAHAIRAAVEDVRWPGRLQLVRWRDHEVLIDGAHNPAGARALASYVTETYGRRLPFIVGILRDKKLAALLTELVPVASHLVLTAPANPRAASPAELAAILRAIAPELPVSEAPQPLDALSRAAALGTPAVVAGSLYLAGQILAEIS